MESINLQCSIDLVRHMQMQMASPDLGLKTILHSVLQSVKEWCEKLRPTSWTQEGRGGSVMEQAPFTSGEDH